MDRLFTVAGATRGNTAVDLWLDTRLEPLRAIAKHWFSVIRARGDDVLDLMHDGCPTACVGEAAFAYVNVFKAHLNVGFYNGSSLDDPAGLLLGGGKHMRHVRVTAEGPPSRHALEALIAQAYLQARESAGPSRETRGRSG